MGMNTSAHLVVGGSLGELEIPEEFWEDYEDDFVGYVENELNMNVSYPWYDACESESHFGYNLGNATIVLEGDWSLSVNKLAKRFETLTGIKAELFATEHVR